MAGILQKTRERIIQGIKYNKTPYLFILPALVIIFLIYIIPALMGFYFSFFDWKLTETGPFVGLKNWQLIFTDPLYSRIYWDTMLTTVYFVLMYVPGYYFLSLALALLLQKALFGKGFFRTIFFFPRIVSIVTIAVIWMYIYHPSFGPLNEILKITGLPPGPQVWLGTTEWAMPAIVAMCVWRDAGYGMLLFIAGLSTIPKELHEAAEVDGHSGLSKLRHVVLPLLKPISFLVLIGGLTFAFQVWGEIYMMTEGGPVRATTTISYYMWQTGFQYWEWGHAAAQAYVLFAIIFSLTILSRKFLKEVKL